MNIKNKVTLITGGARIGQAVARTLADHGSYLVLTYNHSQQSALKSAQYARSKGCKVLLLKADLTLKRDLADIIPKVKRAFGRLDILINMASTYEPKPLKKLSLEDWDYGAATNLKHVYWLSLKAAELMQKKQGGRIINFSDWTCASHRPRYKNLVPYYAAKAGVNALTEVLALELAPKILVNSIAPGPILAVTGMAKKEQQAVMKATPLKRWGGADEIAKAVLFLIETDFVTGECIRVDGGRHLY